MADAKKPKLVTDEFAEYVFVPNHFKVTPEMKKSFDADGAVVVRKLLSQEEVNKIIKSLENNESVIGRAWALSDGTGSSSKLVIWNNPGHDVTGMVARVRKVAKTCEDLMDGEVYHYHTKLMMKEARTGGQHLWHQDYGYWYKNGCLRPDLITVFIALDRCVKENGCLQVVKGTHRCGRIDHKLIHGQTQADPERVEQILKHFKLRYAELEPGDALFFHSNLLHRSDKNESDMRRWSFLCAYNRADNDPVYEHHHAQYTPLHMVPDTAIMECTNLTDLSGKDFMDPKKDKTVRVNQDEEEQTRVNYR
ncbi:hypothetical protein LSH36_174g03057 [Paralvinella palmiformis]|uniref:Uncharacterized protein n=1 Tax=Paralvinella palmiformis TaxID=53620 RepID=A0AAD9JU30_9ANNE|nr:hypothetical protein LSH36_174g03057 [Paralvinella palmiformis]